jgi:uncharacterized HAD superfamily protein
MVVHLSAIYNEKKDYAPYNKSVQHENVTRVHGWLEVYEVINKK